MRDVHLLRQIVGHRGEVEAAGTISTFRQVLDMTRAGADRIGTPSGVDIIKDFYKWEAE